MLVAPFELERKMRAYICCYCGAGDHRVAGCPWTRYGHVKIARPETNTTKEVQ